jgi:hypothetical protein
MKRYFLLWMALVGLLALSAQTTHTMRYDQAWKKVVELEEKSLPQSAAAEVNSILRRAIQEKNSPQVIKALIYQGKYDLVLDEQRDTLIFRNLNEMVKKSTDEVEQSVLHSMLGELYLQYYRRDRWTIDQRTELGDFVPADMKEWTREIFNNKVTEHLGASLGPADKLLNADVVFYAPVVELGKDSRIFYPTIYDFLANRAIEIFRQIETDGDFSRTLTRKNITLASLFSPADEFVSLSFSPQAPEYGLWTLEIYRQLMASLLKRGMRQSVLLTELDKLDYLSALHSAYTTHALPSLQQLQEKWKENGISVEVIDKIAALYQRQIWEMPRSDSLQRMEKTRELYELLRANIARYPEYRRVSVLENRLRQLTQPHYSVSGKKIFPVKGEKKLKVTFKNIVSLNAKLYKIDSPVDVSMAQYNAGSMIENKKTFLKNISVSLPDVAEYLQGETLFEVAVDAPGVYQLTFDTSPEISGNNRSDYYFAVSDLSVFTRSSAKDRYDFFVVNRVTGEPVKGAKIKIYKLPGNWRNSALTTVEILPVNEQGMAVYRKEIPDQDVFYHAVSGNDNGSLLSRLPYAYQNYSGSEPAGGETATIFTDRSLYRPGQTLFFKAVLTRTTEEESSVVVNKAVDFVLRDANNREISKQTLITSDYGSVSGEFSLPQDILTGGFTIETKSGNVSFQVEEYKRPTFEVTFEKIEKTYKFGEEITLKGRAVNFSGISLQQAEADWRITRQQPWWWRWGGTPEHFTEGVVTTDENGAFEITFTPTKPDEQHSLKSMFSFVVEVSVTDLNGETQTGTYTVTVGDLSMILEIDIPTRLEKESDQQITILAKNTDGADIESKGTYQLYSVKENDSTDRLVLEGDFVTGLQPQLQKRLSRLSSGKYRIRLLAEDHRKNPVKTEHDFVLYSFADKRPPIKTDEWLIRKETSFSPGKNAEVILGASEQIHVLYELWQEKRLLERKWIKLKNENRLFSIAYNNQYQGGVTLMLTYVKGERFYAHHVDVHPEKEDKNLKVKLDVFRDRIRPGEKEEWRITVTDSAGNPSMAEVLASMYDFSLDQIYPSQPWNLTLFSYNRYRSMMELHSDQSFGSVTAWGNFLIPVKDEMSFLFDRFNWHGFSLYNNRMMLRGGQLNESVVAGYAQPRQQNGIVISEMSLDMAMKEEKGLTSRDANVVPPSPSLKGTDAPPSIRRNFAETAFFYPRLKTNEKGETQISFTVPESNTRWRFRVLAHDKNLKSGTTEAFTISQKELMVTPNMPRFLRHGDRTVLSTKVSSLSDSTQTGKVMLEFFDPATDEVLDNIPVPNPMKEFSLAKGASSDVSWIFDVPSGIDLLGVRIVARTAQFSDGEQHVLAVLPNRMLVTESMRLDVNGNQSKTFTMDRLLNNPSESARDYRLTLEFASNPAWYALQALPVLGEPVSDNAVSWFASFYANTLGAHIGKAYPEVTAMLEAWKKQDGSKETLLSNLEKNQELKNILLEETPWVLEAGTEAEQKEKLSLLFDLNRSGNLTRTALGRLQELQTNQGGWSWFKGFSPDVGITQYILYGFNRLRELNALEFSGETLSMELQAIGFIDAEAVRRFNELKKLNKDWKNIKSLPRTDLEYLYVRSAYAQHPMDEEIKGMTSFYRSVVEKYWSSYGLYERALITLLLQREGKSHVVQQILNSFREHASVSEEMGMYWPNNRAQVFMSQSAVSVHTFIMDAFRAGGSREGETDNMKRWLLKQKQTQMWESTHATADAVYALLSMGGDWFSTRGETVITVGERLVEPKEREQGTGYIKESWSRNEIVPEMGRVTVTHRGIAPAWGALYRQYYEELDKISKNDASLDIEKQLFVEQTDASGTKLMRVTGENPIRVGDKVVMRLTVRTDRDLEFVHLKDMRAVAFEPVDQLSGIRRQSGILYYQTSKDASTNFYFDLLPRGTYIFEYAVYVTRGGSYANGVTTIQCMYAPEFTSHTAGIRIIVKE